MSGIVDEKKEIAINSMRPPPPCRNSPMGLRVDTKSKLMRQLGSTLDLSAFDFQLGKHSPNATLFLPLQPTGQSPSSAGHYHHHNQQQQQQQHPQHHNQRIAKRSASTAGMDALPLAAASPVTNAQLKHPFDYRLPRSQNANTIFCSVFVCHPLG